VQLDKSRVEKEFTENVHRFNNKENKIRKRLILHCESKKTAPFYFCNNFVRPSYVLIIFGTYVLQ